MKLLNGDPIGSFDKHMEYMQENIKLKKRIDDLMNDIQELKEEMSERSVESHKHTKRHPVESGWWNFYVGQTDGHVTARYKLQQLIEKYS
jgi:uncharacterized protein VirK/YbjX